MPSPVLMDINETARYLTERGIEVAANTLRDWRKTWPAGVCRGPRPILTTPRKLRYDQADCDRVIRETFAAPPEKAAAE